MYLSRVNVLNLLIIAFNVVVHFDLGNGSSVCKVVDCFSILRPRAVNIAEIVIELRNFTQATNNIVNKKTTR
jgi:hypothetical protein